MLLESSSGAMGGSGADFLSVGLGNVDRIPIIEDGDIQEYPVFAYRSRAGIATAELLI